MVLGSASLPRRAVSWQQGKEYVKAVASCLFCYQEKPCDGPWSLVQLGLGVRKAGRVKSDIELHDSKKSLSWYWSKHCGVLVWASTSVSWRPGVLAANSSHLLPFSKPWMTRIKPRSWVSSLLSSHQSLEPPSDSGYRNTSPDIEEGPLCRVQSNIPTVPPGWAGEDFPFHHILSSSIPSSSNLLLSVSWRTDHRSTPSLSQALLLGNLCYDRYLSFKRNYFISWTSFWTPDQQGHSSPMVWVPLDLPGWPALYLDLTASEN